MRQAANIIVEELKRDHKFRVIHIMNAASHFEEGDWRTATLMIRDVWASLDNERKQLGV